MMYGISLGSYSANTPQANCMRIDIGQFNFWFSYSTIVAFSAPGLHDEIGRYTAVRENDWGPTTGKHLNWIDNGDKKSRLPSDKFEALLKKYVGDRFSTVQPKLRCPKCGSADITAEYPILDPDDRFINREVVCDCGHKWNEVYEYTGDTEVTDG